MATCQMSRTEQTLLWKTNRRANYGQGTMELKAQKLRSATPT